jgi:hypothetical protein
MCQLDSISFVSKAFIATVGTQAVVAGRTPISTRTLRTLLDRDSGGHWRYKTRDRCPLGFLLSLALNPDQPCASRGPCLDVRVIVTAFGLPFFCIICYLLSVEGLLGMYRQITYDVGLVKIYID